MAYLQDSQVTQLLAVGSDAMDNMYDVTIVPPAGVLKWAADTGGLGLVGVQDQDMFNLTIRATGFTVPEAKVQAYEVTYKTTTIERPKTAIDFKRQFDLEFRLDANWRAYRFLQAWKGLLVQASTGYATNALWGDGSDEGASEINSVFGQVFVGALARPVHMTDGNPFRAYGVSNGTFTPTNNSPSNGESDTIPVGDDLMRWRFDQVWPRSVSEPAFKAKGGDALTVKASFSFGDYTDPTYSAHTTGALF